MQRVVFLLVIACVSANTSAAHAAINLTDGCYYNDSDTVVVCAGKPGAKKIKLRKPFHVNGPTAGTVVSRKTGATARVSPRYAAQFQAYVDDLEAHGAVIYYMGGYRPGVCAPASLHPCGKALDVCQDYRGHVSGHKNCNLPSPSGMARIAAQHGLFEGGLWCNSDYGHAQVTSTAKACSSRNYATGHASSRGRVAKTNIDPTLETQK